MAPKSLLDLQQGIRDWIYIQVILDSAHPAILKDGRLVYPSGLRGLTRQIAQDFSSLLARHATFIVLRIRNFDFNDAISLIQDLSKGVARTFQLPAGTEATHASTAWRPRTSLFQDVDEGAVDDDESPPTPSAKEFRIDLTLQHDGKAPTTSTAALDRWCASFEFESFARLNIRHEVLELDDASKDLLQNYLRDKERHAPNSHGTKEAQKLVDAVLEFSEQRRREGQMAMLFNLRGYVEAI